ncbi:hypothetical protein [Mycolicibacterium sp.]|uniref:hypothetical protein n=1 Tax=Mycolicibacterium sp. TaxID=2320850 RepID=UPI001D572F0D|nr:hypothetical protein [Mycolicibacterium sp.]MCB1288676.1 hypothetical protein [Mycobacterium sp.]MCB9408275.1 hypothetical protein [Mycolicibacterium sp.]
MRLLSALGAAAIVAAGVGAAGPAGADPTSTEPTASETATTETATPETAAPETATTETATPETSAAPTDAESTSTPAAGGHQVTYTVTTTSDLTANIYYVSADPPDQAAANKPEYMPMARTVVGPGSPWTVQTTLEDPSQWAFVSASGGLRVNPEFRCEIAVDGKVVVSEQGGSGVQCALRPW